MVAEQGGTIKCVGHGTMQSGKRTIGCKNLRSDMDGLDKQRSSASSTSNGASTSKPIGNRPLQGISLG
ncbi:hypothetical protein HPP92_027298 [Vanilla planifolia]|uniref:Uncharacterized protein n=1 Tax=Vanilla planifolia TaxID=51239 RepID=A0A835PDE4_VANPL|nr:hypothetical protein HPP92_027298 [Vanilla planifolia]KAG0449478.1 hypothetical protein HPP92_027325 [Vanilla planifolia]